MNTLNDEEKSERLLEVLEKIETRELVNLIKLLFCTSDLTLIDIGLFRCKEDYNHKNVQRLLSCSKKKALDYINTITAIDLVWSSSAASNFAEVAEEKEVRKRLKQRLQKED